MYKEGFTLEVFVAGIIQRSKYIKRLNPPTSMKTLMSLAERSELISDKLAKYLHYADEYNELDMLDCVFGIDFLLQIGDEAIAIDITTNTPQVNKKFHRLQESAKCLADFNISKWAVIYVGKGYEITEMDLLDIHLDDEKFQLIHLIDCNY